ncbi:MAG: hypothetical protein IJ348_03670 [Alistipes sp.]|nr:hypothetical protein [Alistipes sp.]
MISVPEIRIGLAVTDNMSGREYAAQVYKDLLKRGCAEGNITLKYVPDAFDLPLGTLFFAEYTDVDCVVAVSDEYDAVVAKELLELQIQWNMPIEYVHAERLQGGDNITYMVQLQSEMAGEITEEQGCAPTPPQIRKESIN